jgi:hypothetical protein
MLNLTVAMFNVALFFLLALQDLTVSISAPQAGDTLRGQVEILGRMDAPNFSTAELAFSYASDSADAWFTIQVFSQPTADPVLAVWDTASLTDGDYNLRLRVLFQDGSFQDVLVSDLKIRNDSPVTTEVPPDSTFPQFDSATPLPALTEVPTAIANPSSTPLPANPATVTVSSIYSTFGRGALIVLVLFTFLSLILRLRKNT